MDTIRIAVDRGGTFTDIYAVYKGKVYTRKVLSVSDAYDDANTYGMRLVLEDIFGKPFDKVDAELFSQMRLATTVATNALLERKGVPCVLIVNEGLGDLFSIGDQRRDGLFSAGKKDMMPSLYGNVAEIEGRYGIVDGEVVCIETLSQEALDVAIEKLEDVRSVAIVRAHSYGNADEELRIAEAIRKRFSDAHISLSHQVMPAVGYLDRGNTTLADAYLTPVLKAYIDAILRHIKGEWRGKLYFLRSDGGLCEPEAFRGAYALLSGPAGGVTALKGVYALCNERPLIGFDMGGTSTDVSRYDGSLEMRYRDTIAGVEVAAPSIAIHTVAAGGGSRLFYRNGLFEVGPESAGSKPGPVCYGRGGYLSVTDANVVTGRVDIEAFEPLFGPHYDEPLYTRAAYEAFKPIAEAAGSSVEATAEAFLEVADETMANAIKEITHKRGLEPSSHVLVPFGGAGAQHAVGVARKLGITRLFVPRHASIFSATGLMEAEVSRRHFETLEVPLTSFDAHAYVAELESEADETVRAAFLLRFEGSDTTLEVAFEPDVDMYEAFVRMHERYFGFTPDAPVIVQAASVLFVRRQPPTEREMPPKGEVRTKPCRIFLRGRYVQATLYTHIAPETTLHGPALVRLEGSTLLLDEASTAYVNAYGDIDVRLHPLETARASLPEAARLALYANRFAYIASRMGDRFKRTAVSLNIKEREDFSCAVFDARGNLIVNAPHIPVHLGAMSAALKQLLAEEEPDGEAVYILNAPYQGGSHLPDITVITPYAEKGKIRFWVASRGHHADIGGIVPGSMPADSTRLSQEGAIIERFEVMRDGVFKEAKLRALFEAAGARRIEENINDVKAAISANRSGIEDLAALYREDAAAFEGFMRDILALSQKRMRDFFSALPKRRYEGEERLDSGARIALEVRIDEKGEATFDFSRSDAQLWGNQNTPYAVLRSSVLYALRLMMQEDLPLNEGLMYPVRIVTTEGTLLHPDKNAAVAGGNVTTSQRIVDVILHMFGFAADSQGCMNNITFGNSHFGYYETLGGGEGAGIYGDGRSGIHVHMTNTKITDIETIERRYPIRIERFAYRKNSGGAGKYRGGEGLVRFYRFLEDAEVSLLTERRVRAPRGLAGGKAGACGRNVYIDTQGVRYVLPPKAHIKVRKGEALCIETPGGGGYGKEE
jgi:5-oxoprolinase (ATP-hydrolysing)